MARTPTRRFVRPAGRQNLWITVEIDSGAFADIGASTSTFAGSLSAAALGLRPFTIIRTRVEVAWCSDQNAANEAPIGAMGMIVITSSASAAGVASIPTPITEGDADWFVWQGLQNRLKFASGVGVTEGEGVVSRYTVDSKAMRKVGPDQDLGVMVQNSSAVGASIQIIGRIMVKLH